MIIRSAQPITNHRIGFTLDTEFTVALEQLKDYKFTVNFDTQTLQPLIMDEPPPIGKGEGPSSSRLLASAIGHCLSSSLLFCLQKSRIPLKHISTQVHTTLGRNESGRWRVNDIRVNVKADPLNEGDRERMKRCLEIFEDFCIVTQSVRKGVDVKVTVGTRVS
jgi:organic hydroperoxide reductase OsmC/OhrA